MRDVTDPNAPRNPLSADPAGEEHGMFDFYVAQLEAYLDNELTAEESREVRQRLTQEPAYARALERLHAERQLRLAMFEQVERHEVDPAAADRLVASVSRAAARERVMEAATGRRAGGAAGGVAGSIRGVTKLLVGMAACLAVGFGVGLIGRYDLGPTGGGQLAGEGAPAQQVAVSPPPVQPTTGRQGGYGTMTISNPTGGLVLVVFDESGRAILSKPVERGDDVLRWIDAYSPPRSGMPNWADTVRIGPPGLWQR